MGASKRAAIVFIATPLPFPYSALLHPGGIIVLLGLWPLGFASRHGFSWTPLLVGFISYLLLGLDELARQLEEPLALTIMILGT